MGHVGSYVWELRRKVGSRQLLEYPNGDRVHAFALCFVLEGWEGTVTPEKSEVAEIGFFPLTRIPAPTHPPTLEVLRLFGLYRRTGAFQAR